MEVVVLVEFEAGAAPGHAALLDRIGALALTGRGKLSFVGTQAASAEGPARDVVAFGLPTAAEAAQLLGRWRQEGVIANAAPVRVLTIQPIWSMEPLALMFP